MSAARWENMRGEISSTDGVTTIRVSVDGVGARVDVATKRLRAVPDLYRQILDTMVRDLGVRMSL